MSFGSVALTEPPAWRRVTSLVMSHSSILVLRLSDTRCSRRLLPSSEADGSVALLPVLTCRSRTQPSATREVVLAN